MKKENLYAGHNCAAEGCEATVPSNIFMCSRHWRMVPGPIQRTIHQTLRSWQGAQTIKIKAQAGEQLRRAQRLAIEAVKGAR